MSEEKRPSVRATSKQVQPHLSSERESDDGDERMPKRLAGNGNEDLVRKSE